MMIFETLLNSFIAVYNQSQPDIRSSNFSSAKIIRKISSQIKNDHHFARFPFRKNVFSWWITEYCESNNKYKFNQPNQLTS